MERSLIRGIPPERSDKMLTNTFMLSTAALLLCSAGASALSPTQGDAIARAALSRLNTPYLWGGKTPVAFDCSGLSTWAYRQAGIALPDGTANQFSWCWQSSMQRGALLFFATDNTRPGVITHVGVSLGDGRFVNANSQLGRVTIDSLSAPYWRTRLVAAGTR